MNRRKNGYQARGRFFTTGTIPHIGRRVILYTEKAGGSASGFGTRFPAGVIVPKIGSEAPTGNNLGGSGGEYFCMARPETNQRRGRPALPKGLRKSIVMCARIDLSTYRSCRKAAATEGLRLTEWMRTRLTQAARRDLAA